MTSSASNVPAFFPNLERYDDSNYNIDIDYPLKDNNDIDHLHFPMTSFRKAPLHGFCDESSNRLPQPVGQQQDNTQLVTSVSDLDLNA